MRRLALFLFLAPCAWPQSHEILRPTVDSGPGSSIIGNCSGVNLSSTTMPNSYDASGLSTFSNQTAQGSASQNRYKTRLFTNWAATTKTYTALTLNVNFSSIVGGSGGLDELRYSTDGTNYSHLTQGDQAGTRSTFSLALSTAQDLTKLKVWLCAEGFVDDGIQGPGTDQMSVWDIWTDGTFTGGAVGNGSSQGVPAIQPIMVSEFVDIRRKYASHNS